MSPVERIGWSRSNTGSRVLGVLETDRLPDVLHDLGHVERHDEAALQIVLIEQSRDNADLLGGG